MRKRGFLILALACLMGVAAVYLARGWLESRTKLANTAEKTVTLTTVVVAKRTLSFGDPLKEEYLQVVEWPASAVPADTFRTIADVVGGDKPRVALRTIEPSEPVLKTKISGFGGKATLSSVIEPDMRAVTIRVNDVGGVAGFVLPGDRVDVLLTRKQTEGKDDRQFTDILLQNVRVLAVDQEANETRNKPVVAKAVTVEVTPYQAQKLTLAGQVGNLSLALRKETNARAGHFPTVGLGDLRPNAMTDNAPPGVTVAPPARPVTTRVNVIRGVSGKVEVVPIEHTSPASGNLTERGTDRQATN
jgi:pilus assembly protein CpaB